MMFCEVLVDKDMVPDGMEPFAFRMPLPDDELFIDQHGKLAKGKDYIGISPRLILRRRIKLGRSPSTASILDKAISGLSQKKLQLGRDAKKFKGFNRHGDAAKAGGIANGVEIAISYLRRVRWREEKKRLAESDA